MPNGDKSTLNMIQEDQYSFNFSEGEEE